MVDHKEMIVSKVLFKKYHETGDKSYMERALEHKARAEGDTEKANRYRAKYQKMVMEHDKEQADKRKKKYGKYIKGD